MSSYIVPSVIIAIFLYSFKQRQNTYNSFVFGAKTSFDLILTTFPYLVAIFILIEILANSGILILIENFASPILSIFGIPKELTPLIFIKPFSGSGTLAVLENIFSTYGVDSYIGRCASVIAASSEAIFFVSSVYFSKTKVSKMGLALLIAFICNFISTVFACFICKII